jgi:hypothetical protein
VTTVVHTLRQYALIAYRERGANMGLDAFRGRACPRSVTGSGANFAFSDLRSS